MNSREVRRWGEKTPNAQRRTSNAELPRFKDVTIQRFTCRDAASGKGGTRRRAAQPVVEKLLRSSVCMFLS